MYELDGGRQHITQQLLFGGGQFFGEFDIKCNEHVAFSRWIFWQWQPVPGYPFHCVWFDDFLHCADAQLVAGDRWHFEHYTAESLYYE